MILVFHRLYCLLSLYSKFNYLLGFHNINDREYFICKVVLDTLDFVHLSSSQYLALYDTPRVISCNFCLQYKIYTPSQKREIFHLDISLWKPRRASCKINSFISSHLFLHWSATTLFNFVYHFGRALGGVIGPLCP